MTHRQFREAAAEWHELLSEWVAPEESSAVPEAEAEQVAEAALPVAPQESSAVPEAEAEQVEEAALLAAPEESSAVPEAEAEQVAEAAPTVEASSSKVYWKAGDNELKSIVGQDAASFPFLAAHLMDCFRSKMVIVHFLDTWNVIERLWNVIDMIGVVDIYYIRLPFLKFILRHAQILGLWINQFPVDCRSFLSFLYLVFEIHSQPYMLLFVFPQQQNLLWGL